MQVTKGLRHESLLSLAVTYNTTPNLTYAVSVVSQFMHTPHTEHLDVYHILRYLKTSPSLELFFTTGHQSVRTMQDLELIDSPHLVSILFMVITLYHRKVRNMLLFLGLLLKLSIKQ
mgnify:CR=1 FL=1